MAVVRREYRGAAHLALHLALYRGRCGQSGLAAQAPDFSTSGYYLAQSNV
jgi:hypothetical protein